MDRRRRNVDADLARVNVNHQPINLTIYTSYVESQPDPVSYLGETSLENLHSPSKRTPGFHVGKTINHICIQKGLYKPRPADRTRLMMGVAWEQAVVMLKEQKSPGEYIRPDEIECEGVYGHVDLLRIIPWWIYEIKLTWAKDTLDPEDPKLWRYWMQAGCYCYMWESDHAVLGVGFVNGDWTRNDGLPVPTYREFHRTFTRNESRSIFQTIKRHAEMYNLTEDGEDDIWE